MANFSNISGQEPSTVTFRARTVEFDIGGATHDQEIITLGDPDTSNAVAAVLNTTPASTAWGLVVRNPADSTITAVSSVGGAVVVRSSAANFLASVYQSTAADLNVTVANLSTTHNVSSLAGLVTAAPVSSSGVSMSTDADPASTKQGLIVRQVGYSTTVQVSSVGGAVIARSSAANFLASVYQSTAADLNVTVANLSTTHNVSSLAGTVAVAPASSGATGFFAVRLSDGSTFVTDSTQRAIRVTSVDAGGSTQVAISSGIVQVQHITSSGAQMTTNATPADTSYGLIVRVVGGLTASTTSEVRHISSSGASMSTDTDPASTVQGLIVRDVRFSTTYNVSSLAGAVIVRSSAADMNVTVAGYSTTVNVSSLGGVVAVVPGSTVSTNWYSMRPTDGSTWVPFAQEYTDGSTTSTLSGMAVFYQNGTNATMRMAASTAPFPIQHITSSGQNLTTNANPASTSYGLIVRPAPFTINSTAFSTIGNNSTSATVVSSVASQRVKVFAYSITSTVQAINTLTFASSLANLIWTMQMQSISSGISGANLAVSPPAYLFATDAANPLVFKITGSTGSYHLSFSYFQEP